MLQKSFKTVTEKPMICQQLLSTSPNNPMLLSAAVNGQAVRQVAVPFAFMMRHTGTPVVDDVLT